MVGFLARLGEEDGKGEREREKCLKAALAGRAFIFW